MKKYLIIVALLPIIASAQKGNFSHALDIAIPNDLLKASAGIGWGTSLRYERYISRKLSVIGMLGFISFSGKSYQISTPSTMTLSIKVDMIPIQIGGKFYFWNDVKEIKNGLYISGELGLTVLHGEVKLNGVDENPPNESDFCYAIGIGYMIKRFDLSYRQQFITSSINSNGNKSVNYSNIRIAWLLRRKSKY
jgi:hypothetical protein